GGRGGVDWGLLRRGGDDRRPSADRGGDGPPDPGEKRGLDLPRVAGRLRRHGAVATDERRRDFHRRIPSGSIGARSSRPATPSGTIVAVTKREGNVEVPAEKNELLQVFPGLVKVTMN